jgi:hippurate hydrolase
MSSSAFRLGVFLIVLAASSASFAADPTSRPTVAVPEIRDLVESSYPQLDELYTSLHRNPELSLAEEKTAKRLADELRAAGYAVTEKVGGHGVVAVMQNGPGPVLMIRTDLDALPVKEATGADYASAVTTTDPAGKTVNVMHACGHDVHMTCLVGVARAMAKLKDRWNGTLVLIGQPAEEVGKGAKAMLDDGLFKRFPRPHHALALHVDPELESGKVGFVSGFALANVDSVDVVIRGVGGHGAYPHKTKDPVVMSAQFVLGLQTIASREIRPIDAVVVTVGSIHGGTKHNVIADEVAMQLTVRTYEDDVREKTLAAIERIAAGTARTAGVPDDRMPVVTRRDAEYTPALYNSPELVTRVTDIFRALIGDENVIRRNPEMGGEDFGRYGREAPTIPIFMYRLGSVQPDRVAASKQRNGKPLPSLHSAIYLPDRVPTIKTGVLTMTGAALDLLKPTK